MTFVSVDYAAFLVAILALYWCLPRRPQNLLLLFGSYFFYGYIHHWFLLLILTSTLVDYTCTRGMKAYPQQRRRLMGLSLCANLGLLGFFKYFGFFAENAAQVLDLLGVAGARPGLEIVLPVGISFYTFQTLGYTIDVYRGQVEPRRDPVDFALYVAFFPQLVAGPIERARHFLPQVEERRRFDPEQVQDGVVLLVWGLLQKLVIADNAAVIANKVFLLSDPGFALLWTGVLAFGLQIYADFSGYTDIARGSAKLFGFDLLSNFRHPYLSQTPAEFWQRWHISLSTWFRDYVYIPLGGNRASPGRASRNLLVTFIVSGLWHGASWNFALWGLYHGVLMLFYRAIAARWPLLLTSPRFFAVRIGVCFALIHLGWLFFRERDLFQVWAYLTLDPSGTTPDQWRAAGYFLGLLTAYSLPLLAHSAISLLELGPKLREAGVSGVARAALIGLMLFVVLAWHSMAPGDFIYFRF